MLPTIVITNTFYMYIYVQINFESKNVNILLILTRPNLCKKLLHQFCAGLINSDNECWSRSPVQDSSTTFPIRLCSWQ